MPSQQPTMQSITLRVIFNPAFVISPDSIKFIVSIENAENVVKAPRNHTVIPARNSSLIVIFSITNI